ncbi:MAG TPA: M48 family metalloprotease [Opitutaceae bacterium]
MNTRLIRRAGTTLALLVLLGAAARAQFDFSKLNKALDTAKNVGKVAKGVAGIGPEEEAAIGGSVAVEVVSRYGGLVRDDAITRRVNLVGRALAHYSSRPALEWRFAVLASDTVNAFSTPGGYVFITQGLYDLAGSDDALAAVLAHEIAHITERHALKIVARSEFVSGASAIVAERSSDARKLEANLRQFDLGVEQVANTLFEKGFDPQTEYAADAAGRQLALTTGYAPGALRLVLLRLQQRGGDPATVFATHPPLAERIQRLPEDPTPAASAASASPAAGAH